MKGNTTPQWLDFLSAPNYLPFTLSARESCPKSITLYRGRNVAAVEEKSFVIVCVICMKEFKCDLKVTFLSTNVISIPGCPLEEYLKKILTIKGREGECVIYCKSTNKLKYLK